MPQKSKTELKAYYRDRTKPIPQQKGIIIKNENIAKYLHSNDSGNPHIARDMILFKGKEIYVDLISQLLPGLEC